MGRGHLDEVWVVGAEGVDEVQVGMHVHQRTHGRLTVAREGTGHPGEQQRRVVLWNTTEGGRVTGGKAGTGLNWAGARGGV